MQWGSIHGALGGIHLSQRHSLQSNHWLSDQNWVFGGFQPSHRCGGFSLSSRCCHSRLSTLMFFRQPPVRSCHYEAGALYQTIQKCSASSSGCAPAMVSAARPPRMEPEKQLWTDAWPLSTWYMSSRGAWPGLFRKHPGAFPVMEDPVLIEQVQVTVSPGITVRGGC